jgi:hypothetical protein
MEDTANSDAEQICVICDYSSRSPIHTISFTKASPPKDSIPLNAGLRRLQDAYTTQKATGIRKRTAAAGQLAADSIRYSITVFILTSNRLS